MHVFFPQFNLGCRMNRLLVEIRRMLLDWSKIWNKAKKKKKMIDNKYKSM